MEHGHTSALPEFDRDVRCLPSYRRATATRREHGSRCPQPGCDGCGQCYSLVEFPPDRTSPAGLAQGGKQRNGDQSTRVHDRLGVDRRHHPRHPLRRGCLPVPRDAPGLRPAGQETRSPCRATRGSSDQRGRVSRAISDAIHRCRPANSARRTILPPRFEPSLQRKRATWTSHHNAVGCRRDPHRRSRRPWIPEPPEGAGTTDTWPGGRRMWH